MMLLEDVGDTLCEMLTFFRRASSLFVRCTHMKSTDDVAARYGPYGACIAMCFMLRAMACSIKFSARRLLDILLTSIKQW